jgi:hypothetical protein
VCRLLDRSDALQRAASDLLVDVPPPTSGRAALARGVALVAFDHWTAQRMLLRLELFVTGFALVRLHFEAVVRAVWMLECADDTWLARFAAPVPADQLEEPVLGPPVSTMLAAISERVPSVGGMLAALKAGAWQPMHSYVHGGARPIAQLLAGTTPRQVDAVIRNANGLGLIGVNVVTASCADPRSRGRVARLQADFGDCLPPRAGSSA